MTTYFIKHIITNMNHEDIPCWKITIKNLSISKDNKDLILFYLLILYMATSAKSVELEQIQEILTKLQKLQPFSVDDKKFLNNVSTNEEIEAMKTIIKSEIVPEINNKVKVIKAAKAANAAKTLLLLKESDETTLGGKRKRTRSKKSNKNKKRKSYRKH